MQSNNRALNIRLHNCKNELKSIDQQIQSLRERRHALRDEISLLESQLSTVMDNIENEDKFRGTSFSWSVQAQNLLESVFKLKQFRSYQLAAINATLAGHDVLLVMPTGGGKSLCFQLTALISKGLTLVVSPLISLMEDQLNSLKRLGITTEVLNSNNSQIESSKILSSLGSNNEIPFRILYVTPEKLAKSKRMMAQLEKCYSNGHLKRIVIDEVHCCSQWGHDFRTDYQFLGILRNQFPETPILGLTATATPMVIEDIQKILNIKGCFVFKDSFFRENLSYSIEKVDDLKKDDLVIKISKLIRTRFSEQSGLIYCLSIKEVEEVTQKLNSMDIKAIAYHASLPAEQRTRAYHRWFSNKVQVIVATVAFGMGINKNDVRFVLHYSMSKSFENYYQETGRAGRDGKSAQCILYFKFADVFRATSLTFSQRNGLSNVYSMLAFCLNQRVCRKEQISEYFGDSGKHQCVDKCDNCSLGIPHQEFDIVNEMRSISKILNNCTRLDKKITFPKLIDMWFGKGEKNFRPEDLVTCIFPRNVAQQIIGFLLIDGYLKEEFHFTPYNTLSYVNLGPTWLMRTNDIQLIKYSLPVNGKIKTSPVNDKKRKDVLKRSKMAMK